MVDEGVNELVNQIEASIYDLYSLVNKNSLHVGLHRAKAEENRLHIMANATANDVALRDVATRGLESHLASCLKELNGFKTGNLDHQLHTKFSALKLMVEHLKARIEINKGLIKVNKSLVEINQSMIAVNRSSAQFTDEIILAAASTDVHHDMMMSDVLDESQSISDAMLVEFSEIIASLNEAATQNTAGLVQLNEQSDKNRNSVTRNNKKIHQVIDMVLAITDNSG